MATDYERQWPKIRIEWAREKIAQWNAELEHEKSLLERKKLMRDTELMAHALRDWENRVNAS